MKMDLDFCTETPSCWIIAYGNSQRGDDGCGPYVAQEVEKMIGALPGVGIRVLPQLDLALLEEVQSADQLIFVDACLDELKKGLHWSPVEPELNGWAIGSHHLEPKTFMGLLKLLYDCKPVAWVVSVQGHRFELGAALSPEACRCSERAAVEIVDWLFVNSIALPNKKIAKRG